MQDYNLKENEGGHVIGRSDHLEQTAGPDLPIGIRAGVVWQAYVRRAGGVELVEAKDRESRNSVSRANARCHEETANIRDLTNKIHAVVDAFECPRGHVNNHTEWTRCNSHREIFRGWPS